MDLQLDDTIAAIASAPGGAARAIVRVSGAYVLDVLARCFQSDEGNENDISTTLTECLRPTALVGSVTATDVDGRVPCDAYIWPTLRSYTREPLAELHLPGSPPLAEAVLDAVCRQGARVARPGEFTLRAFLAGRLDLTQAEAVLGVIDATGRRGLDVALAQLAGGLSRPLHALRDELIDLLARLEAGLDFAEEDIEFISRDEIRGRLAHAANVAAQTRDSLRTRNRGDALPRVVLRGTPNVGKSSLFNALVGDADAAITSKYAGTTRDYLSATIDLGGVVCQLVDTAGTGDDKITSDIDRAARQISEEQSASAQIELLCVDVTRPPNAWEQQQLAGETDVPRLVVFTKSDRTASSDYTRWQLEDQNAPSPSPSPEDGGGGCSVTTVVTSSRTGKGIDELRREVRRLVVADPAETQAAVSSTAARCAESLRLASESLARAEQLAERDGEELVAAEVRVALDQLGRVVGAVYTDDVLDRIFGQFCIGK